MFESEYIVYVEENNRQRYKCVLAEVDPWTVPLENETLKIVYFEIHKSRRGAESRLKKMQSLSRLKLIEMIKDSNPEMLNLINCV